ncbi:Reverse transcriptase (RNA-dependent DNA polymerase) [Popillia japonica]|uniref:Reverse transcriptase (RNA-dependent DNA polymerase) n=1 Tax=Popillia japonica TaxID=7064 RepID=A0AAW1JEH0_POPJA
MLVNRLNEKLIDSRSASQYGFRGGRSTEDAWCTVKECVNGTACKYVLGIFVDFKGAFDSLRWDRLLVHLRDSGCMEMGVWYSYFKERKMRMKDAREEVWKDITRGCPQGSICGPAVWNMMMGVLLNELNESGCKVIAYADDLLLMIEGNSRRMLEENGSTWMRMVIDWGERMGVSVFDTKTECMLLKGILSRAPSVRMGESGMKYVKEVKYLGVSVGERMSFRPQLERMREKITRVAGSMSRILRKEWGLRRRATSIIYKGLLFPCVSYGASVWKPVLRFQYGRDLLNRCQRVALYACLSVCRTVSTDAMQILVGEAPWDLECERKAYTYMLKKGVRMGENDWMTTDEVEGRTLKECLEYVREQIVRKWQERWDSSENGRVTYGYIKNVKFVSENKWFSFGLNPGFLLTGHGYNYPSIFKGPTDEARLPAQWSSPATIWRELARATPLEMVNFWRRQPPLAQETVEIPPR